MKLARILAPLAALALAIGFGVTACGKVADCAGICQKYEECVDSDFEVSSCTQSCVDRADEDEAYADRAESCDACVDDRACTETFPCVDECAGVLP